MQNAHRHHGDSRNIRSCRGLRAFKALVLLLMIEILHYLIWNDGRVLIMGNAGFISPTVFRMVSAINGL